MATINLLPWREDLRKQQQTDFVVSIGVAVALTCFIFLLVYMQIEGMKDFQERRNLLINNEIKSVDRKIKEIKDIESKKRKLLTKIEVIQKLQESRPEIVHLFGELATTTPEGVFLTKFKQSGKSLVLTGKAQSNARVSAYMRAIEASSWLEVPVLKVIKGKTATTDGLSDFTLHAKQGNKDQEDDGGKKQ